MIAQQMKFCMAPNGVGCIFFFILANKIATDNFCLKKQTKTKNFFNNSKVDTLHKFAVPLFFESELKLKLKFKLISHFKFLRNRNFENSEIQNRNQNFEN